MKRNNDELMLFSGTANLPLAKKVAKYLKRPLNKIDIKHFPDGETFCQVQEGVRGRDVFVIQSGSPSPNEAYMELFVIMDALKRGSAARITAVIPYYGYARQDRKDQPRVPITARLVANLLEAAGADRVLTMDLHANQIQGFFDIPLDHLHAEPVILKYIRSCRFKKPIVVAPDTGGAKTAYGYSRKLGTDLAIVAKQRMGDSDVDGRREWLRRGDDRRHDGDGRHAERGGEAPEGAGREERPRVRVALSAHAARHRASDGGEPARRAGGHRLHRAARRFRHEETAVQVYGAVGGAAHRRGDPADPRG